MTVLQLISSGGMYGAETALLTLSAALTRAGCRVVIGVFEDGRDPHCEVAEAARAMGIESRLLPCAGRWDASLPGRIRALAAEMGASAVHTHGYKPDLYALAAFWARGLPLVATCHNWPDPSLLMQFYARLDRLALRSFAKVTTPSARVAEILQASGIPEERIQVIPNGVDLSRFETAAPTLREELPRPNDAIVGCVARLVPEKGGSDLIEAIPRVLAEFPDVTFAWVGDGPARAEWESLAARYGVAERIVFTGARRDIPGVLASLDLLMLPSREEAMPMCLLEGLAAGRPVVATNVGAVPSLVIPGRTGLLVEPGAPDKLASAIVSLLQDPAYAAKLAAHGKQLVATEYSSESAAQRYLGLYRELAPDPEVQVTAASSVDVSMICACRNEARHIGDFLDSVFAQELTGMTWELLVADGQSDDGTRQILEAYAHAHPELRVIPNPGRIVSTGLNAAIRASRGRYILRFDAHTRYAADYARQCVATLEATGADNVGGPARTSAKGAKARAIAAAYHSRFSTGGARFHDPDYQGWCDTVPYGCWRRETFQHIGLFDEALVRNQDDEFNLRLTRAGGRVWQNPAIRSWYSPRSTLRALFHQYFQYGFWKVAVIRKHRLPGSWRHLAPAAFVVAAILLPLLALLNPWLGLLWLALAATYGFANLAASFRAARGQWETLPYLPLAFAAFHFSYGSGFLAGLVAARTGSGMVSGAVFAGLSR